MKSKLKQTIFSTLAFLIILGGTLLAGSLIPPSTPAPTMYTLSDIYNLIVNNTTATEGNHILSPVSAPTATSSYSVSEIYARLANLIKKQNIKTGIEYLGVIGNYGVTDTRPDVSIIPSSLTPPAGSITATGYTLEDIWNLINSNSTTTAGNHNLTSSQGPGSTMHTLTDIYNAIKPGSFIVAENVATGTTYLGVTGTLDVPGAPTIGTATAGDTTATITFTAPVSNGGATIDYYTALSSPGGINVATTSATSVVVTGLTNGQAYTFTVYAHSSIGTSTASSASNEVIPEVIPDPCADAGAVAGTVCADGTVYVNSTLRTTPSDAGIMVWAGQYVVTNAISTSDGVANTNNLAARGSGYAAAYYCKNTERTGGHTDWYLPAKDELNTLYANRVAIGNFNTSGNWPGSYYWSSTELSNGSGAWSQVFNDGYQYDYVKIYTYSVRCVRRP
jgi:hypothetical protein